MSAQKHHSSTIAPVIEPQELADMAFKSGNLYRSISIMGKRANQIALEIKEELHSKLEEFATSSDNLEEVFENREQIEISKYYEKLPNPAVLATEEFLNDEIYFRDPAAEEE